MKINPKIESRFIFIAPIKNKNDLARLLGKILISVDAPPVEVVEIGFQLGTMAKTKESILAGSLSLAPLETAPGELPPVTRLIFSPKFKSLFHNIDNFPENK